MECSVVRLEELVRLFLFTPKVLQYLEKSTNNLRDRVDEQFEG